MREPQPYSYTKEMKADRRKALRLRKKRYKDDGGHTAYEDIRFARRLERGFRMIGEIG